MLGLIQLSFDFSWPAAVTQEQGVLAALRIVQAVLAVLPCPEEVAEAASFLEEEGVVVASTYCGPEVESGPLLWHSPSFLSTGFGYAPKTRSRQLRANCYELSAQTSMVLAQRR